MLPAGVLQHWGFTICQTEITTVFTRLCACSVAHLCQTLCSPVAPKILSLWNFSGKNTEMGCHFLLQGIFPTQELNPGLLHLLHWLSGFFSAEPPGKQIITSLGYPKVLNLESGPRKILTGDVNIQSYIIIAHMIMKWPCSQRRKKSLSKSS